MPLTNRRCFKIWRVSFCSRLLFQAFPLCRGMFTLMLPYRVKNDRKAKGCFGLALTDSYIKEPLLMQTVSPWGTAGTITHLSWMQPHSLQHAQNILCEEMLVKRQKSLVRSTRMGCGCQQWPRELPQPFLSPHWAWGAVCALGSAGISGTVSVSASWACPRLGKGALQSGPQHLCKTLQFLRNHWKEGVGSCNSSLISAQFSAGSSAGIQQWDISNTANAKPS